MSLVQLEQLAHDKETAVFGGIDWDATGSMLQGWGTIGGALAVFYAAKKGAATFAAWRRQKQEERRLDAAERILTLAYRLKRNLEAVRSPMATGAEHAEAIEKLQGLDWYKDLQASGQRKARVGQTTLNRLARHKHDWDEIFHVMPIARALFGAHIEAHLQAFWEQIIAVSVAAEMYGDDSGSDPDFSLQLERDIWRIGGKYASEDKVGIGVEEAIKGLETDLLPVIRADFSSSLTSPAE